MLLPKSLAATPATLVEEPMPSDYCAPQCPTCRQEIKTFANDTSCIPNSRFILDCSSCQQCILTYAVVTGMNNLTITLAREVELALNFCIDTSSGPQIMSLESQASRIALLTRAPTSSSGVERTHTPAATTTGSGNAASKGPADATAPPSMPASTSNSTPTGAHSTNNTGSLNRSWIVGPVIGSILGILTVVIVIFLTRRKYNRQQIVVISPPSTPVREFKDTHPRGSLSVGTGKAQLHSESIPVMELSNTEVIPPIELPASEPVGSELSSPMDEKSESSEKLQIPMSPLTQLFAMSELRDQKMGVEEEKKHDTYYHP
ncbi:hypothetical protein F5884DRAFT_41623 [Xylogone sp. PMI_703]|nr:hypothetical protein F5884DRAFT_41623 [Xylogone sp. PMI_703]